MKNQRIFLFVALAAIVSLWGCKDIPTNTTQCNLVEIADGEGNDSAHIKFVLPWYGDKRVNEAIVEQLNESFGGGYEGSYSDVDSMGRYYLAYYMQEMKRDRSEIENTMPYERSLSAILSEETNDYVTIDVQEYQYTGGAHGGTTSYGLTFRKSDGRQMGKNILNNLVGDDEWNDMVKQQLMEYFDVKTEEELHDNLQLSPDYFPFIPLPQTEPCLTEKGLVFTYQQYEIACYAAGMPSYVIPYDKLKKYLNRTGKHLLEKYYSFNS